MDPFASKCHRSVPSRIETACIVSFSERTNTVPSATMGEVWISMSDPNSQSVPGSSSGTLTSGVYPVFCASW